MIFRKQVVALLFSTTALFGASFAESLELERPPYLQMGTPTSLVVRWRTDLVVESTLRYGSSPSDLSNVITLVETGTEHEVPVSGLTPNTTYYYSVGTPTETLAGADIDHFFTTSPPQGTEQPVRILVLGDSGRTSVTASNVRDEYLSYVGFDTAELLLLLGDNAYLDGTDAEYTATLFQNHPMVLRNTMLWPTIGNHDLHTANAATETGAYYDAFTLPTAGEAGGLPSGSENYYSFDYANIHFLTFETNAVFLESGTPMYNWVENDLAANDQEWTIVFMHQMPYTRGTRDSDTDIQAGRIRTHYLPLFDEYGVDLVLSGHSHVYERSMLISGHYGTSDTLAPESILDEGDGNPASDSAYRKAVQGSSVSDKGVVYIVNGVAVDAQLDVGLDHPVMINSIGGIEGSTLIDIDGDTLSAIFLSDTGAILDEFQITHTEDVAPLAEDIQINTYINGDQRSPAVAANATGTFVAVWMSEGGDGTDNDGWSIQGQRFTSAGVPAGDEFQINTYTVETQSLPAVAMDDAGDFIVVWQSEGSTGSDDNDLSIQGQRFSSNGTPVGSEFQINSYIDSRQSLPTVAINGSGNAVVAWRSWGSSGSDDSGYSIQAQRIASNGTLTGSEFQVNSYTANTQSAPSASINTDGNFVIVWESHGSPGNDSQGHSIQGQSFSADGTPAGTQLQINTEIQGGQYLPRVSMDDAGNFLTVWESDTSSGSDDWGFSIQGRRVAFDGTAMGSQFQINTYIDNNQYAPTVFQDATGNFVVLWESNGSGGDDDWTYSIQGQRFSNDGSPMDSQFQLNTYTIGGQYAPAVAMDDAWNLVAVWESESSGGSDDAGKSIQGRRLFVPEPGSLLLHAIALGLLALLSSRPTSSPTRR